jgi:MoxR-like ATPase
MADINSFGKKLITNLEKVIVGKRQPIELIVVGLLCQEHVLIEDVPGVGKTVLARSLAKSLGCFVQPFAVHPRYASQRCDRRLHLQPVKAGI